MRPPAHAVLEGECERVAHVVLRLSEDQLALPTRCPPWDVKALVAHLWRGLFRIPTALKSPAPERANTDAVSYWLSYDPPSDASAIAARAEETAAAYSTGAELAKDFQNLSSRCVELVQTESPSRLIELWWGPAIRLDVFLKTRVVEMVVHGLDLTHALEIQPVTTQHGIHMTKEILAGLLGQPPPAKLGWTPLDFIERGTGRVPLSEMDRSLFGGAAEKFPLLA